MPEGFEWVNGFGLVLFDNFGKVFAIGVVWGVGGVARPFGLEIVANGKEVFELFLGMTFMVILNTFLTT
jgi:hypothetical protein